MTSSIVSLAAVNIYELISSSLDLEQLALLFDVEMKYSNFYLYSIYNVADYLFSD